MPLTPQDFSIRADRLRDDLVRQGRRVQGLVEDAFESVFTQDRAKASATVAADDAIDRADVEIERASVALLTEAACTTVSLSDADIRRVLTLVKVNNELERLADAGVVVAEGVQGPGVGTRDIPPTFRVMANSVVGIIRDAVDAYERTDPSLARIVLASESTIDAFKAGLLREAEQRIASGDLTIEGAFSLHEIAGQCERMSDYCSNIAEQVIYTASGTIVRHTGTGWVDVDGRP